MRAGAAVAAIGVVIALTGCGSDGVERDARYGTVAELKDAAVAAGYDCPNWEQTNQVTPATESGSCSAADVFSIYLTEGEVSQSVESLKRFGLDTTLLVGPNWIINTDPDAISELRPTLGGVVVTVGAG